MPVTTTKKTLQFYRNRVAEVITATRAVPAFHNDVVDIRVLENQGIESAHARDHAEYTGRDNRVILDNVACLAGENPEKVKPRLPLIPGITATIDNLRNIARFLKSHGCNECAVLPYNSGGLEKLRSLGVGISTHTPIPGLSMEEENRLQDFFREELA